MIEHAFREQDKVALQLAENLYRHLVDILVADYAALPRVDRHAFIVRVFGTTDSDDLSARWVSKRIVVVIVVATSILVALLAIYFRFFALR